MVLFFVATLLGRLPSPLALARDPKDALDLARRASQLGEEVREQLPLFAALALRCTDRASEFDSLAEAE